MAKDRLRHRKAPFAHFHLSALGVSLGKALVMQALHRVAAHDAPKMPSGGANAAKLIVGELLPGFLRDVLVSSTARGIEHVVVKTLPLKIAGQLMRGEYSG